MFDLGWSKLIIIAMLAIIVVGPKDLPALLRTIGKFVGQIRRQAEEFRRQFDEAMKDTELDQIRKDVEDIKRTATESVRDIERTAEDSVKPFETAASEISNVGQGVPVADQVPQAQIATEIPAGVTDMPPMTSPDHATSSLTKAGA